LRAASQLRPTTPGTTTRPTVPRAGLIAIGAMRARPRRLPILARQPAADSGPPAGCRGRRGCHESARQALTATCTEGPPGTGTRKLRLTSALTSLEDQFSWAGSRAE
jgi:hypothetical protein